MLTEAELGEMVSSFWQDARKEWSRLSTLQKRVDGKLLRTWMPDNADLEYKDLFKKASSPWLAFACDAIGQGCRVDGYTDEQVWERAWQASGMDGRQGAATREAIALGYFYGATLPSDDGERAVMRPMSALKTFAVYEDPFDDRPQHVLHMIAGDLARPDSQRWMFIDDEAVYRFGGSPQTPQRMTAVEHELSFCPVVRVGNTLPVDGVPESSVEAAIPVYQRIVDATFTLQMVQRYGAFPQKWMAGGELAKDANGNPLVRSSVDGLLHASGEAGESARFGTFAPANLDQVVAALDAHIKHFSALVQVPPHYLLGAIVNMSAEGIAAAESGYFRNIRDRQDALGEGYEMWLRDAAAMLDLASANNLASEVHWSDEQTRSISQVADAIQKLATNDVDAPLEMLFALIPGWSKSDAVEAAQRAELRARERLMLAQNVPAAGGDAGTTAAALSDIDGSTEEP